MRFVIHDNFIPTNRNLGEELEEEDYINLLNIE
jgi:hypothetical protein